MRSGEARRPCCGGYAYVLLLLLLAVLATATAGSVTLGHALERRAAERALLDTGEDFRLALRAWQRTGGPGPATLQELLRDPRAAGVVRHLRRLPHDPLTGNTEWGLLRDAQGRIAAVYSLAPGRPLRRGGFDAMTQPGFEDAESYAQWRFGLLPQLAVPDSRPTPPTPPAPPGAAPR